MATATSPGTGTSNGAGSGPRRAAAQQQHTQRERAGKRILGIIVLVVALIALVAFGVNSCGRKLPVNTVTSLTSGVVTPASYAGNPTTWKMAPANHKYNRWFAQGISLIGTAKSNRDAREAVEYWLEGVKMDPVLLASTSQLMLHRKVEASELVDKNGWATAEAASIYLGLKDLIASSKVVVDQAPRSGYNTGIFQGKLVRAGDAVIKGDRKAIRITAPSGESWWILGRCGNIALPGQPKGIPSGPTDNEFCGKPKGAQGNPNKPDLKGSPGQKVNGHAAPPTATGATRGGAEATAKSQDGNAGSDVPVKGGITDPSPPSTPVPEFKGETPTGTVPGI